MKRGAACLVGCLLGHALLLRLLGRHLERRQRSRLGSLLWPAALFCVATSHRRQPPVGLFAERDRSQRRTIRSLHRGLRAAGSITQFHSSNPAIAQNTSWARRSWVVGNALLPVLAMIRHLKTIHDKLCQAYCHCLAAFGSKLIFVVALFPHVAMASRRLWPKASHATSGCWI